MENKVIPLKKLGNSDLQVSRMGLGCMGLNSTYTTNPVSEEQAFNIIEQALNQGVNFFDTAYFYGNNEELLGKAIKKFGRDKFIIATKVPPYVFKQGKPKRVSGTKENIKQYCEESLKRLQIDYIDVYYMHRIDAKIPIESQVKIFKELIKEGKIKYYGLSEASEDSIRRAHKVCPLAVIQEEYSLFTREIETNGVFKTCQELDIAIVAYSPLGRGVLTGTIKNRSELDKTDSRQQNPRFDEESLQNNLEHVKYLEEIAKQLNCTPSQIALSWLLSKGDNIFPIPGTKREKYLKENNDSAYITIPEDILKDLDEKFNPDNIKGLRYAKSYMQLCTVTTPQLNKK